MKVQIPLWLEIAKDFNQHHRIRMSSSMTGKILKVLLLA